MKSDKELTKYIDMMANDFIPQLTELYSFTMSQLSRVNIFNRGKIYDAIYQKAHSLSRVLSRIIENDIYDGNADEFNIFMHHLDDFAHLRGRDHLSQIAQWTEMLYGEYYYALGLVEIIFDKSGIAGSQQFQKNVSVNQVMSLVKDSLNLFKKHCNIIYDMINKQQ